MNTLMVNIIVLVIIYEFIQPFITLNVQQMLVIKNYLLQF